MKKYALFLLLLSSNLAYSQTSKSEVAFLTWFFQEHIKVKESILYLPDLWPGQIEEMKNLLKGDTLYTRVGIVHADDKANGLVISKKERKRIDTELENLKKQKLPDHLFPNARIIERDTVDFYLKDRGYGWSRLYKKNIKGFYSLTKPIFLRNNTICIFLYGYNCGNLCGIGSISVYKNIDGKWSEWIQLLNWIS